MVRSGESSLLLFHHDRSHVPVQRSSQTLHPIPVDRHTVRLTGGIQGTHLPGHQQRRADIRQGVTHMPLHQLEQGMCRVLVDTEALWLPVV